MGRANFIRIFTLCLCFLSPLGVGYDALVDSEQHPPPPSHTERARILHEMTAYELREHSQSESISPNALEVPSTLVEASKIVFDSYRNDNWELYIANGDGSGQTRLTNRGATDIHPRLNRGCTQIAFATNRDGDYEINTMNVDGTSPVKRTNNSAHDYNPVWSPDGMKIAFQSDRDGQFEIYVMNADGTGQARLTVHDAYDGEPTWSPDGAMLAFTSNRSGTYRIYSMSVDGSDIVQLTTTLWSENPVWSPDGRHIAYDADMDNDGWTELWLMNADGSDKMRVYDPTESQTDAYARSWSPDGRSIIFTRVSWIYTNNWYWTTAYLDAFNYVNYGIQRLSSTGDDWDPDWQACDLLLPDSAVNPLPELSPAYFIVDWSGTDSGLAGIMNYDVQVRDGIDGTWEDWLVETLGNYGFYHGLNGHAYYFRSIARDNTSNIEAWPLDYDAFTSVESLPPVSSVEALGDYTPNGGIIPWSGDDIGGSGIASFDIQVRQEGENNWQDWKIGTAMGSANFTGTAGERYVFRSRAMDQAQNVEEWPSDDGDASTLLYSWGMNGIISNNQGLPVVGATVNSTPEAFASFSSAQDGWYGAYVSDSAGTYTINWDKNGYGSLPDTQFNEGHGGSMDVVLPPLDNLVANWGFENSVFDPWIAEGSMTPQLDDRKHTGQHAALLGSRPPPDFSELYNISNNSGNSYWPKAIIDHAGTLHVTWYGWEETAYKIFYSRRSPDGIWSSPEIASSAGGDKEARYLAVDDNGVVHLVWAGGEVYHSLRDESGTWSTPQNISNMPGISGGGYPDRLSMTMDSDGSVHIAWSDNTTGNDEIFYTQRFSNGYWTEPENLTNNPGESYQPWIAADEFGNIHLLWIDNSYGNYEIFYLERSAPGTWSSAQNLSLTSTISRFPKLTLSRTGDLHVVWTEYPIDHTYSNVFYTHRVAGGVWSDPELISDEPGFTNKIAPLVDESNAVHLLWGNSQGVYYSIRGQDGIWGTPEQVYSSPWASLGGMQRDGNGVNHIVFSTINAFHYVQRGVDGRWTNIVNLTDSQKYSDPIALEVDNNRGVHILWTDWAPGNEDIFYKELLTAEENANSQLSQNISIPLDMETPILSFFYKFSGGEPSQGSNISVEVSNGLGSITLLSKTEPVVDWQHCWFDLSPWSGQMITLTFGLHQAEDWPFAWAYIDEVSIGSATPDLWINKSSQRHIVAPGGTLVYTLSYGNQGGASINNVQITDTLPSEVTFISANLTPVISNSSLVWDIGSLPARSNPYSIVMTTTVSVEAPLWSSFTNLAQISVDSVELEGWNNASELTIDVGRPAFLPLLR